MLVDCRWRLGAPAGSGTARQLRSKLCTRPTSCGRVASHGARSEREAAACKMVPQRGPERGTKNVPKNLTKVAKTQGIRFARGAKKVPRNGSQKLLFWRGRLGTKCGCQCACRAAQRLCCWRTDARGQGRGGHAGQCPAALPWGRRRSRNPMHAQRQEPRAGTCRGQTTGRP